MEPIFTLIMAAVNAALFVLSCVVIILSYTLLGVFRWTDLGFCILAGASAVAIVLSGSTAYGDDN
jgi:hypothetical protein